MDLEDTLSSVEHRLGECQNIFLGECSCCEMVSNLCIVVTMRTISAAQGKVTARVTHELFYLAICVVS